MKPLHSIFEHVYHIASFMPGIGLTIGYLLAWIATAHSPLKQVEVADELAEWKEVSIGEIPKWRFEFEPYMGKEHVVAKVPTLSEDGTPVITRKRKVISGRGIPSIYVKSTKEIFIPYLGDPPFIEIRKKCMPNTIRRGESRSVVLPDLMTQQERDQRKGGRFICFDYYANKKERSTGVFEVVRDVSFEPKFDPNSVSIWWGIGGTVLGLLVFYLKKALEVIDRHKGRSG